MKIKKYFDIDNLDKRTEVVDNKQNKIDFLDFQNIKEDKSIDKNFYEKQIKEFKEKNPSWYEILENMWDFLKNNKLDNTKSILATKLFIEEL